MLAIGAGKHAQALAIHAYGVDGLKIHMPQVAAQVMANTCDRRYRSLEDGAHHLTEVHVVPAAELLSREAELLGVASNGCRVCRCSNATSDR